MTLKKSFFARLLFLWFDYSDLTFYPNIYILRVLDIYITFNEMLIVKYIFIYNENKLYLQQNKFVKVS